MKLTKKKAFSNIKRIVGKDNFSSAKEDLACYAYDATARTYLPDGIVFPANTREVAEVMAVVNRAGIPVIPRGAGSGMTGGSLAVEGGIILSLTRFDKILEIDTDNLIAHVEPGVVTRHFQTAVEEKGLMYPPDPSSADFSTLGGNLAECAGGPRAVKYGVTRDYVLGLEIVLPAGEIINTGVQTAKGVVGYDLTRLFVGSEGTLGIITKMTLRLLPLPEAVRTMTAVFSTMADAAEAVSEVIRRNIIPRTIEYLDNASIRCAETHLKVGLPVDAAAMLIIEVDGKDSVVDEDINHLAELCREKGADTVNIAKTKAESEALWKARKAISPSLYLYGPDKINEDIVVPRSRIPDMVRKISEMREKTGLTMVSFGHAGDGNIHFNIMLDKKNRIELEKADAAIEEMFDFTLALGGTISGEHGVGITKAPYIEKEIGTTELNLMWKIKTLFDPNNILNPGKIFPDRFNPVSK
ncbi:MAG: FAD-binding protein [Desulfobacterales bacterium]|nr:FAD-binding protein [Desulfobacterales bacterium]